MTQDKRSCPACLAPLKPGLHTWHHVCSACTYEGSSLEVDIDVQGEREVLDEALRQEGLSDLRQNNFSLLAAELASGVTLPGQKPRLLDVGCGHGWFLKATADHFSSVGIEPDARVAEMASSQGVEVRKGFFPDALESNERFDVISFNDVLEHIPDVAGALGACVRHLKPGGRLVINAPARTGVFYRVAGLMNRLGMPASFERMWQKGFPSPHVHYFDDDSIRVLGRRAGLKLEKVMSLPSLSTRGLYARIRYDRSVSAAKAMMTTAVLAAASPMLRVLPADIKVWVLTNEGAAGQG